MFEPLEYAVLARQLVIGSLVARIDGHVASDECRLRAALGRAYYALYLSIRGEIARRHNVPVHWITHGALHTFLRHSKAGRDVQALGHELRRLYALRQQADYEVVPASEWARKLADATFVEFMTRQAMSSVSTLERLDFAPVAELLRR